MGVLLWLQVEEKLIELEILRYIPPPTFSGVAVALYSLLHTQHGKQQLAP
jgi:hypothetical protein